MIEIEDIWEPEWVDCRDDGLTKRNEGRQT